jgi:hypothetical protein
MLYFHDSAVQIEFAYSFILDWVTMVQGLPSARRTSVNGTSKLNPGNGLMVMTVLTMTKMFRSLMPKPLMSLVLILLHKEGKRRRSG